MENFSKLESERLYVPNATFVKVYKIAGMVTLVVDSGTAFFNKNNTSIFTLPEKYRPNETLYFSASYRNSTKSNTFFLFSNGNLIKLFIFFVEESRNRQLSIRSIWQFAELFRDKARYVKRKRYIFSSVLFFKIL